MTCNRYDGLLVASLDQPLDAADQTDLDAHLLSCPRCVERMTEYVITSQLLRELGAAEEVEACPPLPERLVVRLIAMGKAAASDESRARTG